MSKSSPFDTIVVLIAFTTIQTMFVSKAEAVTPTYFHAQHHDAFEGNISDRNTYAPGRGVARGDQRGLDQTLSERLGTN